MEGVLPYYERAARQKQTVARVHSGDPSLWGAIQEQLEQCARARPGHRDRAGGVQLHRGRGADRARADHPGGRPVGDLDQARGRQDPDAARRAGGRVRPPPDDHGAVPFGGAVRSAAGRTAGRRLPAGHPVRRRLPGDLAGRADRALRAGRPGRHHQGTQALEAHAGPGRARPGRRRQPLAPVPPGAFPRVPQGGPAGQEATSQDLSARQTTRDPADRPRAARARPAADGEGQEAGPAHRLDHRDLRGGGREGGQHRADHRGKPGHRGDRPAVRPAGPVPGGGMHPDRPRASAGGRGQGRGRRPRRHARRAADRHRALARPSQESSWTAASASASSPNRASAWRSAAPRSTRYPAP